ncbi:uncharacterized protein BDV17DRAFT_295549 [Aspergillus undulatus]|uniref:uncharacterized protein n=1 Tax=Aspergillus undulatus TaxID=1810928 RepID=UPI003CCD9623
MAITWDPKAETKLLLGILAQLKGTSLDYKALAAHMGPGCSVAALHQHICKLRREAGIPAKSPAKARNAQRSSATSTPKKPASISNKSKRAASPETPTDRAKKRYRILDEDEDSDDDVKVKMEYNPVIKDEDEYFG